MVSVRGPNRNLLMGVASPQREKSCVAPSTDAPCFPPPSLGRSEGGEEAEEGACYFGSLGRRCEKNSWLSPKRARSPLVGHYCASCSVGWIECARARRGGSIVGISWGCKVKSTAERRLARLGDTATYQPKMEIGTRKRNATSTREEEVT